MKIDSAYYTKHKDTIILQFPYRKYEFDEVKQIFESVEKAFPENQILIFPDDISISVLREENPFL